MSKKIKIDKTSSNGIILKKAFVVQKNQFTPSNYKPESIEDEINKFETAISQAKIEIEKLAQNSDIFKGHLMIVEDIILYDAIIQYIKEKNKNAQQAVFLASEDISKLFLEMDDEYMKERANDIKDVSTRLMAKLLGKSINPFESINEEVIIIANDMTPSDTALLDLNLVKGFITEVGGTTSHVSIIAKNLDLPCIVGVGPILSYVKTGDLIAMNASNGEIIINPTEEEVKHYNKLEEEYKISLQKLKEIEHLDAITKDNVRIKLCANVGNLLETEIAKKHNIDGIGLFRIEGLFLESDNFPTEEYQFEIYKKTVENFEDKEVIIRTLDIGGDKTLSYYKFDFEENPFLGFRAIRFCLENKDIFKTQLRAILRASAYGNIKIMYPMIISVNEVKQANTILDECKKELDSEGINYNKNIKVGIMIETPASVVLAEDFAKLVDFFSIGTNDLTQYTLVVDRGNKKISNLYDTYHPAVLKSIERVIEIGHKYNIEVGICGEFASDVNATKILVGMGIDELSMSASSINKVKEKIINMTFEEAKKYKEDFLNHK